MNPEHDFVACNLETLEFWFVIPSHSVFPVCYLPTFKVFYVVADLVVCGSDFRICCFRSVSYFVSKPNNKILKSNF